METHADGVIRFDHLSYRGKSYEVPVFDTSSPTILRGDPARAARVPDDSLVIHGLNSTWDVAQFLRPRAPVSLWVLGPEDLRTFARPGAPRVLDMPIKFPDIEEVRLPRALRQFAPVIWAILDFETLVNPQLADYFAYLTIDQRVVRKNSLHREAPCHVDGFQGARWHPRCRTNHSYTVSDVLPTAYYVQPFALQHLDERTHDFFWEMNAQVADTAEAYRWQPQPGEITLMDCYCVHRGVEAAEDTPRTWLRLSFEERRRVFDRLGNAHNPLFDYDWPMVERDIEALHLRPYRQGGDPTLSVFPWQDAAGNPLPPGAPKTKPRLS